jgi:hypothetical protein
MADRQLAQCIHVKECIKEDRKGYIVKKEIYTMWMEGREFLLSQSKFFTAERGKIYAPCIYVFPDKKARVYWQEAEG